MSREKNRKALILGFVLFLLALMIITILLFFHIQRIEVRGNEYLASEEVISWIREDKYASNSLYAWNKYSSGRGELHPNIEAVEVEIKNPWTIAVDVYEKKMVGFLQKDDQYVFFGRDGSVLKVDHEFREDVPLVEGLIIEEAKSHEQLKVENEGIFKVILEVSQIAAKNGLTPTRIMIEGENVYMYIGAVCVNVGTENLERRIMQIPPIMEKLGEERGLLHLENYRDSGDNIPFQREVWPTEIDAEAPTM